MYKWATLLKDFHKSQMLISGIESGLTREDLELENSLWETTNDYSPAQREYEDLHYKEVKQEERPF